MKRSCCSGGAVDDEGGQHPGADLEVAAAHVGLAEGLVDDQLLDGPGVPPPRRGPVGDQPPALGDAAVPLGAVLGLQVLEEGLDLCSGLVGLGRQVDGHRAAGAAPGPFDDEVVPGLLAAQQLAGGHGPAQEEVGVVLPGEADAAVDLHAALGAEGEGLGDDSAGDGGGQGHLVVGPAPGGVPGDRPGQLQRAEHVRAAVLDRLELPDGSAELLAVLRVGRRGVHAPGGAAGRLGGQQRGGQVPHQAGPVLRAELGSRRLAVETDRGQAPRRVEALVLLDGHALGVQRPPAVPSGDHDHARRSGAEHRTPLAVVGVGGERHRSRRRAVAQDRQQGEALIVVSHAVHHRRRQDRRQDRPRGDGTPELLQDDGQLGQPEAGTPVLLGDVQSQPPQPGQLVPERRQRIGRLVQRRPRRLQQPAGLDPLPGRLVEGEVVLGDPQAHRSVTSPSRPGGRRWSQNEVMRG